MERHEVFRTVGTAAAGLAVGATSSAQAAGGQAGDAAQKNPYGGQPGSGITLPPYFKLTPDFPKNFRINPLKMIRQKLEDRLEGKLNDLLEDVGDGKLKERLRE